MVNLDLYLEAIQMQEFVIAPLALVAYEYYKRNISRAGRYCEAKKRNGKEFSRCIINYKILLANRYIGDLKKAGNGCGQAKDPKKCAEKIQNQIQKEITKLNRLRNSLAGIERRK